MCDQARKVGIGTLVANFAALQAVDLVFDWVLYPSVLLAAGTLVGGAIMTFLSLFNCCLLLIYSERQKEKNPDFLAQIIGDIRRMRRDMRHGNWAMNVVRWIFSRFGWSMIRMFRKSRWLSFLILSVVRDPFQTMLWLRAGKTGGLRKTDWFLFLLSGLICNLSFIIRLEAIFWPLRVAWQILFGG